MPSTHLHDDWLTDEERQVEYRELQRQDRVRELQHPTQADPPDPVTMSSISSSTPGSTSSEGGIPPFVHTHPDGTVTMPELTKPVAKPVVKSVTSVSAPTSVSTTRVSSTRPSGSGPVPDLVVPTPSVSAPAAVLASPGVRRSQRSTKGSFQTTRYINEAYVASLDRLQKCDSQTIHLAYLAEVSTCCDTGIENVSDPRAYAAKTQGSDPGCPTFHQAMNGEHSEEYITAMQLEIMILVQQRTWTSTPRTAGMNVLKSTWAFQIETSTGWHPLSIQGTFLRSRRFAKRGSRFFRHVRPSGTVVDNSTTFKHSSYRRMGDTASGLHECIRTSQLERRSIPGISENVCAIIAGEHGSQIDQEPLWFKASSKDIL